MNNPHRKARILVVEDNRPILLLLSRLLSPYFEVELAKNVDEALHSATRQHFDLFVLDINLGEARTGVDLLAMLRGMADYSATPAVACTAFAGEQYRELFLSRGFDEYVDKPFTRPALLHAVEEALADAAAFL